MLNSLCVVVVAALSADQSALFVFGDEPKAADAAEARAAKALKAANVSLVDVGGSAQTPPNGATTLMTEGRAAFEDLDTPAAAKKFKEAADWLEKNPGAATPELLAEAHLFLGAIAMQGGTKPKAIESMARAASIDPTLRLDTKFFGSDIKKEWDRIVKDLESKPKVRLTVSSMPSGVVVSHRGHAVGTTPLASPLMVGPGRHLVTFSRPGYVVGGTVLDVSKDAEATIELKPTPQTEALRAKARELAGTGADQSVPAAAVELGRSTQSRFVLVASADGKGGARINAFDTTGNRALRGVSFTDDASATAAAEQINSFIKAASSSSVASSTTGSGSAAPAGEVETAGARTYDSLASMRGANTLGSGMAVRGQVSGGTSGSLTGGVIGIEAGGLMALRKDIDVGAEIRLPFAPTPVFAPGVSARWRFAQDGKLTFAAVGTIHVPIGLSRGSSIGLAISPGVMASYNLTEKTELMLGVLLAYNHLFKSSPSVVGTGYPGLMGTVRAGMSYALSNGAGIYANLDLNGGYEPLRRNIAIGNVATGAAMSASLIIGFQMRIN